MNVFLRPWRTLDTYLGLPAQAEDADEVREQVVSLRKLVTQIH